MGVIISSPYIDLSQIVNASKPTTRIDGSALVTGDRWYSPTTGIEATWNGTYWLSPMQTANFINIPSTNLVTAGGAQFFYAFPQANNLYLIDFCITFYNNSYFNAIDANNFLTVTFTRLMNLGNGSSLSQTYNTFSGAGAKENTSYAGRSNIGFYQVTIPINTAIPNTPLPSSQNTGIQLDRTVTGSVSGTLTFNRASSYTFSYIL